MRAWSRQTREEIPGNPGVHHCDERLELLQEDQVTAFCQLREEGPDGDGSITCPDQVLAGCSPQVGQIQGDRRPGSSEGSVDGGFRKR